MAVSVIVTSYNSPATLRECLLSLAGQSCGEIVVADCSDQDPAPSLAREFPAVNFLRFSPSTPVPVLRWSALTHTRFDVVLAVEARCVPAAGWVQALSDAHLRYPTVPAIGGAVHISPRASRFDWGLYFCEYGRFAPPLQEAESADLSGANLSYKRDALTAESDLLQAGAWETLMHVRWRERGLKLVTIPAAVVFCNSMSRGVALRQRFHYGRGYAGNRARRWRYLPLSPLLALPLTWRIARDARRSQYSRNFWAALPWVLALTVAWSLGELVGYAIGPSRRALNF